MTDEYKTSKSNSTERSKQYRKRFIETNNMTNYSKKRNSLSIDEKNLLQSKSPDRIENLTEQQRLEKKKRNNKSYKKNKKTLTRECSYQSSLHVKWDYENPCEL